MTSGKAGGTGDGTAVTEREHRIRMAISQEEAMRRAIRASLPREIAKLMGPRMKQWDIDYAWELVQVDRKLADQTSAYMDQIGPFARLGLVVGVAWHLAASWWLIWGHGGVG